MSRPLPPESHRQGARILLFTGKGGVGKTTTAAATALTLAESGHRVVLTSADAAHSLGDAFDRELGSEPRELVPNLWAQQVDALERMEESWGDIRSWLVEVFDWAGMSTVEAEELSILPGVEELVSLLEIDHLHRSGDYDVIVVDCAPTAESLRLLSLPDMLDWYMQKFFPATRRVTRVVGPILTRFTDVPVAGAEVFSSGERLQQQLRRVRDLLMDSTTTSVRLVMTPERMVVSEARRSHTYLALFGYHTDCVVVNRVVPADAPGDFLDGWRKSQAEQLDLIAESFSSIPALTADMQSTEVIGATELAQFGASLWAHRDPLDNLSPGRPLEIERISSGRAELRMELPNVDGIDVGLTQQGGEISVSVGPYRRNLFLPDSLRGFAVSSAVVTEGELRLILERGSRGPASAPGR